MAKTVDYKSIFNTVLPNVYIKKISLITSSLVDDLGSSHYDDDIDYEFVTNEYGKQELEVRPINFAEASAVGNRLMVKVELTIKDHKKIRRRRRKARRSRGRQGDSTWIENDEVLNMLKLRVLLSSNPQTTEELRNRGLTEDNIKEARRTKGVQEKVISLRKRNHMNIQDFKKERVGNKVIYSVMYKVPFVVRKLNPQHLALFAYTFIDLNEFSLGKETYSLSRRRFLQGTAAGSLIINKGRVPQNSFMYMLGAQEIWAGPVHINDKGPKKRYMAGAFHTQRQHRGLKQKKVLNRVVQDYRSIDMAKRAKLLLRPKRIKPPGRGKSKTSQRLNRSKKLAYISEPEYSVNQHNDLFLSFNIDYNKIINEKTQFGGFIRNLDPDARARLYELCFIRELKIFRNRVVKGVEKEGYNLVDYEDRTELIAESSEGPTGLLKEATTTRPRTPGAVESRDIVIGSIREVDLGFTEDIGIRTFTVSDFGMSSRTDGKYNYTLEASIIDGTVKFVEEQLEKLKAAKNFLNEYYSVARDRKFTDVSSGDFTDEFRDIIEEQYKIPSMSTTRGANLSERTTALRESVGKLPWNIAAATYIDILFNLTNIRKKVAIELSDVIFSFVSPVTGTLPGIEIVMELLDTLESQIVRALGTQKALSMDERDYNMKTTAYKAKIAKDYFFIQKTFKKAHDSNIQKRVGYDFLDTLKTKRSSPGHRVLTPEQLETRFASEHSKYFQNAAPTLASEPPENFAGDLDLNKNYYGFLSPARIKLDQVVDFSPLQRGASLLGLPQYDSVVYTRMALNPQASRPPEEEAQDDETTGATYTFNISPVLDYGSDYSPSTAHVTRESYSTSNATSTMLATAGVVIQSPTMYAAEILAARSLEGESEENEMALYAVQDYLGDNTKFVSEVVALLEENPLETPIPAIVQNAAVTAGIAAPIISTTSGLFGEIDRPGILSLTQDPVLSKTNFVIKLPNQIKSLYLSDSPDTAVNWADLKRTTGLDIMTSPKYSSTFYLNYGHLNRIEVLTGFQKNSDDEFQVSAPIYRRLSRKRLLRAARLGRRLFCRMVSYSNSKLKIKKNRKLGMPEFDSRFFIEPSNSSTTTSDIQLEADAEAVAELIQDTGMDVEESDTALFVVRLTEGIELYKTGLGTLARETTRIVQTERISPEFQANMLVLQPNIVSRVGTNFGSDEPVPPRQPSGARAALVRMSTGQVPRTEVGSPASTGVSQRGTESSGPTGGY